MKLKKNQWKLEWNYWVYRSIISNIIISRFLIQARNKHRVKYRWFLQIFKRKIYFGYNFTFHLENWPNSYIHSVFNSQNVLMNAWPTRAVMFTCTVIDYKKTFFWHFSKFFGSELLVFYVIVIIESSLAVKNICIFLKYSIRILTTQIFFTFYLSY